MAETTVRDWMHSGVVTCRPDTPVADVARTMDAQDISALVVIGDAGDAIGVISRTDLVNAQFVQPYLKHWPGLAAEHLMSRPAISIAPDALIEEAANLIRQKRIHRLVVVDVSAGRVRPIGILSVTDLARHVGEQ